MGSQKWEMGNEKLEARSGKWEVGNGMWEFTTIWIFQSEKWDPEKWEMGLKREFSFLKYPAQVMHETLITGLLLILTLHLNPEHMTLTRVITSVLKSLDTLSLRDMY